MDSIRKSNKAKRLAWAWVAFIFGILALIVLAYVWFTIAIGIWHMFGMDAFLFFVIGSVAVVFLGIIYSW